jgi:hypothetical protein
VGGYLNRLEARLAEIDHSLFLAWWNQYAGTSSAGTERWDKLRSRLMGRDDLLKFLRSARDRPLPPLLARRIELIQRISEDSLVEQHPSVIRLRAPMIRREFAFAPTWEGRRTSGARLRKIVRTHDNRQVRHRAYVALQELSREMEHRLPRLIEARNARAREIGYRSFMEFRLRAEGLTLSQLEDFIGRISRAGRPLQRRFVETFQERSGESGFFPWDSWWASQGRIPIPDSMFPGRTMARDVLRTIRAWGFRGAKRPFQIVQRSIPVGGMTLAVQIPSDVRVAVNPHGGWLHYSILAHELGHAVQDHYTRAPSHVLRGPENIPGFAGYAEGIATLFEWIPAQSAWLRTHPGVTAKLIRQFHENMAGERLRVGASTANWVWKEIQMYKQPTADLSARFHRADIANSGFSEFPMEPVADPFWIETAFYSKSYLLAAILAAQLRSTLREQVAGPFWPNHRAIPWLARNLFRHGARYDWVPRIAEVTGRPFGVADFLDPAHRDD